MSEVDGSEATRREFEAVMRLSRFASIEQVAGGLRSIGDSTPVERRPSGPAARRPRANAPAPPLPSRNTAR